MFDYDSELRRYYRRLRAAFDVGGDDRVLDIGCGTGQTTRDAARRATQGSALGVDTSPLMVARARALGAEEELGNVRFEQADAQTYPFPTGHFTLGISRFGTMFFADPVAAFTNIARALSPGARLVQLVWQGSEHQEWLAVIHRALTGADQPPPPATVGGPFSFADPATAHRVLTAAGFTDIGVTEMCEPVCYGANPAAAFAAVLVLYRASELLTQLDTEQTYRAHERLRSAMAAHDTGDGVWFDSRAWLVTARIPG